jgi:argininosuccinate synthase
VLEGKKVVLAYSGGLDTSVCLKWLEQRGAEPYALYLDLGQGEPEGDVKGKALKIGAADAFIKDAKAEFADEYVAPAIRANALYGGKYPLFTALGRPLIAKKLVRWRARWGRRTSRTARRGKATTRSASTLRRPPSPRT